MRCHMPWLVTGVNQVRLLCFSEGVLQLCIKSTRKDVLFIRLQLLPLLL